MGGKTYTCTEGRELIARERVCLADNGDQVDLFREGLHGNDVELGQASRCDKKWMRCVPISQLTCGRWAR